MYTYILRDILEPAAWELRWLDARRAAPSPPRARAGARARKVPGLSCLHPGGTTCLTLLATCLTLVFFKSGE